MEKDNPKISMRRQCELLGVARATAGYQPIPEDPEDLLIKRLLDELYMRDPCLGVRRLVTVLERDYGLKVNRKRLIRLRDEMGQQTIYLFGRSWNDACVHVLKLVHWQIWKHKLPRSATG